MWFKKDVKKKTIKKLLIANRGEIAVRIIRTCKDMGIESVAIYTPDDRDSIHVRLADYAFPVSSYLNVEEILSIAKKSQADAIHPGYGFLSENHEFAKEIEKMNLIFVGPDHTAMKLLGDKIEAKKIAKKLKIPMVPSSDLINDTQEALKVANQIGYPVIIKNAAAGGGRGIRICWSEDELIKNFEISVSESEKAFGKTAVYIEKFLQNPKHIEVQLLSDKHGNVLFLFERDCSIQRRYQKIIEEAPAPTLTPKLRSKLKEASVKLIKKAKYHGAATVEFLVDGNEFYFMEVNTRIQVEHPVTEAITGLDLIKLQILAAQGENLKSIKVPSIPIGHAIELRIVAEDYENNWMPSAGKIEALRLPEGPGVRNDCGVYYGDRVKLEYDSMISKLIIWGSTREEAIARAMRALDEFRVEGVKTNIWVLQKILSEETFKLGNYSVYWLGKKNFKRPQRYQCLAMKIAAALFFKAKTETDFSAIHSSSSTDKVTISDNSKSASYSNWRLLNIPYKMSSVNLP